VQALFFGNYFYGFCAVALSVEAALQQHYPLNDFLYYTMSFAATVVFYTKAYVADNIVFPANERAYWYAKNNNMVKLTQIVFSLLT
ncbi:hypothetical protein ABTM37_20985, partial [Acinetobacter baumannii]